MDVYINVNLTYLGCNSFVKGGHRRCMNKGKYYSANIDEYCCGIHMNMKRKDDLIQSLDVTIDCSICMCNIEHKTSRSTLFITKPCNHVFHKKCIEKWVQTSFNKTCPLCRTEIVNNSREVRLVQPRQPGHVQAQANQPEEVQQGHQLDLLGVSDPFVFRPINEPLDEYERYFRDYNIEGYWTFLRYILGLWVPEGTEYEMNFELIFEQSENMRRTYMYYANLLQEEGEGE